jgi:hypothetical protein
MKFLSRASAKKEHLICAAQNESGVFWLLREKRKEREAFSLLWYIHTSRDRHLCPEIKKNFILDTAVCHCYRNINAISSRPIFLSRNDFKQREEIHSAEDTLSHTELPVRSFFSDCVCVCVCTPSLRKRAREILYPPRFLSYFHKGKVNRAQ